LNPIPQVLHQTWKSKIDIPENFALWRQSFLDCNPGIEARLYDDADNRALLAETFPSLLPLYEAFPREIFRADFIRPIYLFRFGGVYADMDFQCLQPLCGIRSGGSAVVLGRMGENEAFEHSIPNAIMLSQAGQGFWIGVLAFIEKAWHRNARDPAVRPERVTGPVVLREAVSAYLEDRGAFQRRTRHFMTRHRLPLDAGTVQFGELRVLPAALLYPLNWRDSEHRKCIRRVNDERSLMTVPEARAMFPHSIAVTYWSHSWEPDGPRRTRGAGSRWWRSLGRLFTRVRGWMPE
jgi:inositol phosphorylceramide mannosyltransferase catalytic subunit